MLIVSCRCIVFRVSRSPDANTSGNVSEAARQHGYPGKTFTSRCGDVRKRPGRIAALNKSSPGRAPPFLVTSNRELPKVGLARRVKHWGPVIGSASNVNAKNFPATTWC
jgi:hypothetical protein